MEVKWKKKKKNGKGEAHLSEWNVMSDEMLIHATNDPALYVKSSA